MLRQFPRPVRVEVPPLSGLRISLTFCDHIHLTVNRSHNHSNVFSEVCFISSRLQNFSRQRTASMYVRAMCTIPRTTHCSIATRTPRARRRPRRARRRRIEIAAKYLSAPLVEISPRARALRRRPSASDRSVPASCDVTRTIAADSRSRARRAQHSRGASTFGCFSQNRVSLPKPGVSSEIGCFCRRPRSAPQSRPMCAISNDADSDRRARFQTTRRCDADSDFIFFTATSDDSSVGVGGGSPNGERSSESRVVPPNGGVVPPSGPSFVTSRRASTSDRTDATDRLERWRKIPDLERASSR